MAATHGLAAILRDAAQNAPLLRMRAADTFSRFALRRYGSDLIERSSLAILRGILDNY
jgi:hypothetical protein